MKSYLQEPYFYLQMLGKVNFIIEYECIVPSAGDTDKQHRTVQDLLWLYTAPSCCDSTVHTIAKYFNKKSNENKYTRRLRTTNNKVALK